MNSFFSPILFLSISVIKKKKKSIYFIFDMVRETYILQINIIFFLKKMFFHMNSKKKELKKREKRKKERKKKKCQLQILEKE